MMRCRNRFLLLFLALLLTTATTHAQLADTTTVEVADDAVTVPETEEEVAPPVVLNHAAPSDADWSKASTDKAFSYKTETEFTPQRSTKPPEIPGFVRVIMRILGFLGTTAGKVLLFILLALLVGYILYRIFSGNLGLFNKKNRKISGEEEPAVISEEDLLQNNWEAQLQKALSAGDQRMAIRYSYMYLLQLLQARDLIQYRQDKTNTAYYHELSGQGIRQQFRQITRQYEYAWYGNFLPAADAFATYLHTFNDVKKALGAS